MKNLNSLLKVLIESDIDFILIGGYAGVVHGANRLTRDLDICAALTEENLEKLRKALKGYKPVHRMNPNFKPSLEEHPKTTNDLNALYLETNLGVLDVLKNVKAVGNFEDLNKNAVSISLFGNTCKVISLEDLIKTKEALNRDKDKSILKELYAIRDKVNKK